MLTRFSNWPEELDSFIERNRKTPFEWGRFDCALFACDAMHIMTGVDPAEPFRFQYGTALGAAHMMKRFAGGGLEELAVKVAAQHGLEEIQVNLAQRGDVVLFDHCAAGRRGKSLGIVCGSGHSAALPGIKALMFLPTRACRRAWRVG